VSAARLLLVSLALVGLAALPAGAGAAAYVPPGNSAANQYTEAFPTSGGNAETKGKGKVTARDVLGAANAKELEAEGKQGREAAEVVAATAPPAAAAGEGGEGATAGGAEKSGPSGAGSGGQAGGDGGASAGNTDSGSGPGSAVARDEGGSSGFSEVLGQATGSTSSGGTGLLLPLVILASVIWALAFFLRRRRPTA
jgi:hypothetical protein